MHGKIVLLYDNEVGKCLCDAASRVLAAVAVAFGHRFALPLKRCPAASDAPDDVLDACADAMGVLAGTADMKCLPAVADELMCAYRVRELRYTQLIENRALLGENRLLNAVLVQAVSSAEDALQLAANRAYVISSRENLPIMHVPPAGKLAQAWKAAVDGADSLSAPFHARELALPEAIPMMLRQSERVGVVLCPPYAGAVIAPTAALLAGGMGMGYDEYAGGQCALYASLEQPDTARADEANPYGMLRAVCHLLREALRLDREAACVEAAIRNALQAGWRTADIALPDQPVQELENICELICEQIEVAGEWIVHG